MNRVRTLVIGLVVLLFAPPPRARIARAIATIGSGTI